MLIAEQDGYFTRAQALEAGLTDREIRGRVRSGEWIRIRRGAYVVAAHWNTCDPVQRHRIRARAVLRSLGPAVALSHVSGVIAHGIDTYGINLDRVHVTRLDGGAGRIEGDVVHHEGFWLDADVVEIEGMRVLRAERCVLEAASRSSDEVALCLLDSGLRAGAFDKEQLASTYAIMRHWPFAHHLATPVDMADGRSGSVGESRGRWFFHAFGLPAPELQVEVRRADGSLVGITDWAWRDLNVYGEFDGAVKYGRLLRPGQEPGEVVFGEKHREDEIREITGASMFRVIWTDYDRPKLLQSRLERILRIAS